MVFGFASMVAACGGSNIGSKGTETIVDSVDTVLGVDTPDANNGDTGTINTGTTDTNTTDTGSTDTGSTDTGSTDTGTTDSGSNGSTVTVVPDLIDDDPAVDDQGRYDLGRYIVARDAGTYKHDYYLEEDGSLSSNGGVEINLPQRSEGVWIEDTPGFIVGMSIDYKIREDEIDVRIDHPLLPIPVTLPVERYAKVGDDILVGDAPFNSSAVLISHKDTSDTVIMGDTVRTDSDVLTLEIYLEAFTYKTRLTANIAKDLGGIYGQNPDCIVGIILPLVDDNEPRSECNRYTISHLVLDPQNILR